jgi:uncharacterized protein (TIGR03437 family)
MQMHNRWLKITILILLGAVFVVRTLDGARVGANANRPPSRQTGAPGENNCTSCHDTAAVNSGGGTVTLTGLPASYAPSQAIPLTVQVAQTGLSRFGFQVTAIDSTGKQAGTIVATDTARTVLSTGTVGANLRQYIGQTSAGTNAGSWSFTWNAPATPVGTVTFYVAGLTANNDGDTPGDFTYTISRSITPAAQCTYAITPTSANVAATGGTGTVAVTAGTGCAWTATSNAAFITITSGASGTGNGMVGYTVAANTLGTARTGTLTIAGQTFTVNQAAAACTYAITPTSASIAATGGSGTVAITAGMGCAWTAASNTAWITITSATSGSGNGSITYMVAASTGPARTSTLTIAGLTFTVNQAAAACTYAITPTSANVAATGGTGMVAVTAGTGCMWTATSNAGFITITSGASGTGNGTVAYTVATNTGAARTGTLTVAGLTFTVNQAAGTQCTYAVIPTSTNVGATGGTGSVSVTTAAGCTYTATSNAAFITITSGASGTGNGTVTYTVAANTGAARTGTITIAGQTFTVNQAVGTQCAYTLTPVSANVAATGGSGSVAITTAAGCAYTATSNAAFITITSGASGSGPGTVNYTVAANTGAARTGTLTIAGQTFTVNQAASQMQMGCYDDDYEFKGTIQSLPSTSGFIGDWMVSGRTVRVGMYTKIEAKNAQVAVGAVVEIEGCVQTDGTLIAKEIEVKSGPGANYTFTGNVELLPDTMGRIGDWKVSGVIVHVATATMIKQGKTMVALGVRVEVEGMRRADGSVDANKIEAKSDMGPGQVEFQGTVESLPSTSGRIGPWSIGGRMVNVTASTRFKPDAASIAIGFTVIVRGTMKADGSIDATEIELKSRGGGHGSYVEFNGTVEMLPGTTGQIGVWTVSGRKVNVVANTKIDWEEGPVVIGSKVRIRGSLQADGSINAVKIKVKDHSGLFEFKGVIESLPAAANLIGDWRVGGRTIRVVASTVIERKYGMVVVGAFVEVHGLQQSDGSIAATEIEVKGPAGGAYMNFTPATTVSAASYAETIAPEAIVSAFGANLSSSTGVATSLPLPTLLGDASVMVDGRKARMFWASPNQINFQVPSDAPAGSANVVVMRQGQPVSQGTIQIASVALGLFTANASGMGAPAGVVLRVKANGQQSYEPIARYDAGSKQFVPVTILRNAGEQLYLILFGTGLKQAANTDGNPANGVAENVLATIGGVNAQVVFAGVAAGFAGLEQINIRIPDNAPANPSSPVVVRARDLLNNWKLANGVTITLQ